MLSTHGSSDADPHVHVHSLAASRWRLYPWTCGEGMDASRISACCKATLAERDGRLEVLSPATPFVERMVAEQDMGELFVLAANALGRDPCCIEAHLALAGLAENEHVRLDHLKVAVMTGAHLWDPVTARDGVQPDCARHPAMAPYAHALGEFGEALAENGNVHAARFCFRRHAEMTTPGIADAVPCPSGPHAFAS